MSEQPRNPSPPSTNGLLILVGVAALFAVFSTEGQPMHFHDDSVTGSRIPIPPAPLPPVESPRAIPPIPSVPFAPTKPSAPAAQASPPPSAPPVSASPAPAPLARAQPPASAREPAARAPTSNEPESANIDASDVKQVLHALVPQFKSCYAQAIAQRPDTPGGKLVVEFTLARDVGAGSVPKEGSIADSTLNAPLVEACILDQLRQAKFPEMKGSGTVKVRYPLTFTNPRDGG